ncbi:MAG TPA: hypothetical protein PKU97_18475, partial [Kofleriaceae bacterium]|nr:hypothetical protein [Kofleriaceae bacterium]
MAPSPSDFPTFTKLVASAFQAMAKTAQVFVTGVDGDALYQSYLASFPAGTDPMFAKSTEHDCSCCKQFLRRAGSVVTVDARGAIRTVWDEAAAKAPYPYNEVAAALRREVLAADIADLYRVRAKETGFGAAVTRSLNKTSGKVITWDHLHTGPIPTSLQAESPEAAQGDYRTTVQVFVRGLTELTPSAVETVISLVEAKSLYRGEEHKQALQQFHTAQQTFLAKPEGRERNVFAWTNAHGPASRFRNTVIGTLVQDLSEGRDLEASVQSFESKVAPQNYKRTSALITPRMVQEAMATIETLGLEAALERRFAVIGDISVNDVKWVDNSTKPLMKGGLGDALMQHAAAASPRSPQEDDKRAEPIGLDEFVAQ